MNNLKVCHSCACFCWLVSEDCIVSLSELTSSSLIRTNDINNTNSDVSDLIGEKCFRQLCTALTLAVEAANAYNSDPLNISKKGVLDFLEAKWAALISDMYFKSWYANRVAWHWLEGASITQLKTVGLITTSNSDEEFKNGFKHAEEAQRKRLAAGAERYASNAALKFKLNFWDCCSPNVYDCLDFCNNKEKVGESIGMSPAKH